MTWVKLLRQEAEFPFDRFYRHKGIYVYRADPPKVCPVCGSGSCRYHVHGSFVRWLTTYVGMVIKKVRLRKPRFKCVTCGHTFSLHPPEGIPRKPTCTFVIVLILWSYLVSPSGYYRCLPEVLGAIVSERTLARYLAAAKHVAEATQQCIREVLIEKTEPRPVEELFQGGGLDPPESLLHKQRHDPDRASTLWRALSMLYHGATTLLIDPRTLLAWAHTRSQRRTPRFLL